MIEALREVIGNLPVEVKFSSKLGYSHFALEANTTSDGGLSADLYFSRNEASSHIINTAKCLYISDEDGVNFSNSIKYSSGEELFLAYGFGSGSFSLTRPDGRVNFPFNMNSTTGELLPDEERHTGFLTTALQGVAEVFEEAFAVAQSFQAN